MSSTQPRYRIGLVERDGTMAMSDGLADGSHANWAAYLCNNPTKKTSHI